MEAETSSFGRLVRDWRQKRRMSQLALASEAEISSRHLSFLESGRSAPSRDMVLRLAEHLEAPLRTRNRMLLAAGFAPAFPERPLADPTLGAVRTALETLLRAHEPFPALAVDRHWNLVAANRAVAPLMAGAGQALLESPTNVLRLSLHPEGIAPRIENFAQWRSYLLRRLARQVEECVDAELATLYAELTAYPFAGLERARDMAENQIAVPLRLRTDRGLLCLLSTTTVFDAPRDVTISEIMLETFLPADMATHERLSLLLAGAPTLTET
jgi:transcriptional regulator with XRE-family HTH domain